MVVSASKIEFWKPERRKLEGLRLACENRLRIQIVIALRTSFSDRRAILQRQKAAFARRGRSGPIRSVTAAAAPTFWHLTNWPSLWMRRPTVDRMMVLMMAERLYQWDAAAMIFDRVIAFFRFYLFDAGLHPCGRAVLAPTAPCRSPGALRSSFN